MEELIDIEKYRKLVKSFIDCRRYQTALFWAEKLAVINNNDPQDVYMQAHCLFLLKEYHRSTYLIKNHGLEKTHILCYNLILECLYESKEFSEAVNLINSVDLEVMGSSTFGSNSRNDSLMIEEEKNEILASVSLLKGKIFEAMDNRSSALDFYVQALQKSVFCVEAMDALLHHEMLVAWEEKELISSLPFSQQCTEADVQLLKILFESKLKKYYEADLVEHNEEIPIGGMNTVKEIKDRVEKIIKNTEKNHRNLKPKLISNTNTQIMSPANKILEDIKGTSSFSLHASITKASILNSSNFDSSKCQKAFKTASISGIPLQTCINQLSNSTDIMAMKAGKYFYEFDHKSCLHIIDEILKRDPYHDAALTIQIGCLVELEDYNKLFFVAHKLVDRYPEKPISWYAVGCYYDIIGKSDPARRYLAKATSLDRMYGPAWLAYGHSFAKENEHDQAMAAYFKATQLMRGCHLPLLYIGVECGLTKNLELAENFFYQAMSIAPLDVFVFHELGVIKYEYDFFESAEEVFRITADFVNLRAQNSGERVSAKWEPLFNNLGHCCRKNKKYEEAIKFHQVALLLKPYTAETLTALGFVYALMGNLDEAIQLFHKSLAINRNCVVTFNILKTCTEDLMDEDSSVENFISDELPPKPKPGTFEKSCDDDSHPFPDNYNVCDMSIDI